MKKPFSRWIVSLWIIINFYLQSGLTIGTSAVGTHCNSVKDTFFLFNFSRHASKIIHSDFKVFRQLLVPLE